HVDEAVLVARELAESRHGLALTFEQAAVLISQQGRRARTLSFPLEQIESLQDRRGFGDEPLDERPLDRRQLRPAGCLADEEPAQRDATGDDRDLHHAASPVAT